MLYLCEFSWGFINCNFLTRKTLYLGNTLSCFDTEAILTLNSYYMCRRTFSFLTGPREKTNVSSDLSLS